MDSSGTVTNNFGQSKSVQIVQIQSRFLPEQGRKYYDFLESSTKGWLLSYGTVTNNSGTADKCPNRSENSHFGWLCHDIGACVCYHEKKKKQNCVTVK